MFAGMWIGLARIAKELKISENELYIVGMERLNLDWRASDGKRRSAMDFSGIKTSVFTVKWNLT